MQKVKAVNLAIVGATGMVGETMLRVLEERHLPIASLCLAASERSAGRSLSFKGQPITVQALSEVNFKSIDIALFSAGKKVSEIYAPKAAAAGCVVIDNSSQFRYETDIPLVIPEINAQAMKNYRQRGIIANPNCSTIAMLMAVHPIHQAVGVRAIDVATYQSVSGAGAQAVEDLRSQTEYAVAHEWQAPQKASAKPIAFNAVPQIDQFQDNGFTREEMKMVWETQKILDASIEVNPTCVRVPVFYAHSLAVHLKTRSPISQAQAIECLTNTGHVKVVDALDPSAYPTAATVAGQDEVYVGRIRPSNTTEPGLNLWVVSDNLRKGAALNTVQIAEQLLCGSSWTALPV